MTQRFVFNGTDERDQWLVTIWDGGTAELAFRPSPDAVWGPPHRLVYTDHDEEQQ
jgi:hypothetical protein